MRLAPIILLAALVAPVVLAAPTGPAYPPPGGVTLTPSGNIGRAGGLTWSYSAIQMGLFNGIWWGPWGADSFQFALDGAISSSGETLVYDFSSPTSTGVARWLGSTSLRHNVNGAYVTETVATRLTLRAMLPSNAAIPFLDPTSVALDGDLGAVIAVPGDYKVNVLIEAQRSGVWTPAYDLYDSLHTDPACASCVRTSVGAGFYTDLNRPPVAAFSWGPAAPRERENVTFTSSSSDPEGRPISQAWDLDNDGAFDDAAGGSALVVFHEPGSYTVSLRVTDDRGLSATRVQEVVVADCSRGEVSSALRNTVYPAAKSVAESTTYFLACDVAADELGV